MTSVTEFFLKIWFVCSGDAGLPVKSEIETVRLFASIFVAVWAPHVSHNSHGNTNITDEHNLLAMLQSYSDSSETTQDYGKRVYQPSMTKWEIGGFQIFLIFLLMQPFQ